MYNLNELSWIELGLCEKIPLKEVYRRGRVRLARGNVEFFIDEIIETYALYFSISYEEFSKAFDLKNPNLQKDLEDVFKTKTGFTKRRLRISVDDEDFIKVWESILVPDINRVEMALDKFCKLPLTERADFWMMLQYPNEFAEGTISQGLLEVYNMYNSFYHSEKNEFVKKWIMRSEKM